MKYNKSQGMALITLIVSMILATILIVIVIRYYTGGTTGEDSIQSPIDKAKRVQCIAQRRNIDTAIQMYNADKFRFPSSLSHLKELTDDLTDESFYCPMTRNPYNYDSQTGKVSCPDHS